MNRKIYLKLWDACAAKATFELGKQVSFDLYFQVESGLRNPLERTLLPFSWRSLGRIFTEG